MRNIKDADWIGRLFIIVSPLLLHIGTQNEHLPSFHLATKPYLGTQVYIIECSSTVHSMSLKTAL